MKKIILAVAVFGFISATSCKNEGSNGIETRAEQALEDAGQQAVDMEEQAANIKSAEQEAIEVPEFSNEQVQNFANDYAKYFEELLNATKSKNTEKTVELTRQGIEWTKKANEITQGMNEEDTQKWTEWTNRLRILVNGGE